MINYFEPKIDLTLLGCGFLGFYQIGAIYLLGQIWPQKPYSRICGASCGGLIAALHLSGNEIDVLLRNSMDGVIRQIRSFLKNPTRTVSIMELIRQMMEKLLPPDAHERCSGKLGISLTKMNPFENEVVTEFKTRDDLIAATSAGCFIPIWSGSWTCITYKGQKCLDGAYTNNVPRFELTRKQQNEGHLQVAVSPFANSEIEVSPDDKSGLIQMMFLGTRYYLSWNNIVRASHALFPFAVETYQPYFVGGHQDMKEFVLRNNLVKCRECYEKRPKLTIRDVRSCIECLRLLEKVDSLRIPEEMLNSMRS